MKDKLKTIKEVSKMTGITVRTLHYYDEINLLKPHAVMDNGYRMYNSTNIERVQQIMFFKELDFPLKEISKILKSTEFDAIKALKSHKHLLMMKRDRLNGLINLINNKLEGSDEMSFKEFGMNEIEKVKKEYAEEVKEKYGHTNAYKQSQKKISNYTKEDWEQINADSSKILKGFAENMDKQLSNEAVQQLVVDWQDHISKYYYDCTDEILLGLAGTYTADERFAKNIDKHGEGLAQFMSSAIENYCENK